VLNQLKKEAAINKVKQFLDACAQIPIKIDKAILFGSAVNNKSGSNADIDLALFSPVFSDNILKNLDIIGLVNIQFPEIDVHTYPTTDFNKHGLLIDEIKKTGVEISI
jgi:predicted nucleotidyltransferase